MRYVGIDPSTKTGLAILGPNEKYFFSEVKSTSKDDPQRFIDIADFLIKNINENDVICIEGFSYGSRGKGVSTQYGIGWLIRAELIKNGYSYYEVSPSAVKKFATGKGNTKKDEMVLPIYKRWGFEHSSDNVRDAYVLARIAQAKAYEDFHKLTDLNLTEFQKDVMKKVK